MSRLIVAAAALMLGAAQPTLAGEQGAAAGVAVGAVAGAVVGGPVGAVIGAVVGGVTGGVATGPEPEANQFPPPPAGRTDRETTGSIVQERVCVRQPDGTSRCRIVR